ncbi:MAG TPA: SPFH domain-containing protein [Anaerolineales bacterium]|nr:SPFH domain-containing protein [Anaerolineales bacterium]
MTTIMNVLYRPTENHVGVIYSRWGKFKRFAHPNKWTLLSSTFELVAREVRLDVRTAKITLENVLTRDKVAIDLEMKVFYSVDVRQASEDRRIQVLRFENDAPWDEIVKTGITDIARNVIVISRTFDELATEAGMRYLKQALSGALAPRVRGFGILMNRFAVGIMSLQPNETFRQALQERSAATAMGNAAAERVRPMLDQLNDHDQKKAFINLVMQIASAVAKNGQSPDILFPHSEEFLSEAELGRNNGRDPLSSNMRRVSPPRRPDSIAGD